MAEKPVNKMNNVVDMQDINVDTFRPENIKQLRRPQFGPMSSLQVPNMISQDHHPRIFLNRGIADSPPPNIKEAKVRPLLKYQIETRRIP
jgi:hypothetical protein